MTVQEQVTYAAMGPLTEDNVTEVARWCGGLVTRTSHVAFPGGRAKPGDYVVLDAEGRPVACRPRVYADDTAALLGLDEEDAA